MDKTVHRSSELARDDARGAAAPDDDAVVGPSLVRRVESVLLFERAREVIIVHRGQEYRLRITKSDKLILTK
jgi:hemin uptake protein HemP